MVKVKQFYYRNIGNKLEKSRKIVRFVTKMQKIVAFIPNLFTLGNLFCGCLGIIFAFQWRLDLAAYMVFLAAFLDFFDGFFARLLKVDGELGKQLDSLADMVSFGVVPGVVMYHLLGVSEINSINYPDFLRDYNVALIALMIPIFSAYRLAKFNIDTRQSHGFIGLPTPANAIFFCSIPLILGINGYKWISTYATDPQMIYMDVNLNHGEVLGFLSVSYVSVFTHLYILVGLIVVFSFLLVSEIPLFALKFKNFGWTDNKIKYIFIVLSITLLILFQSVAVPFIVILYILLSIVNNIFKITG